MMQAVYWGTLRKYLKVLKCFFLYRQMKAGQRSGITVIWRSHTFLPSSASTRFLVSTRSLLAQWSTLVSSSEIKPGRMRSASHMRAPELVYHQQMWVWSDGVITRKTASQTVLWREKTKTTVVKRDVTDHCRKWYSNNQRQSSTAEGTERKFKNNCAKTLSCLQCNQLR